MTFERSHDDSWRDRQDADASSAKVASSRSILEYEAILVRNLQAELDNEE